MKRQDNENNELVTTLRKTFVESGLSLNALNKLAGTQYASTHRFFTGERGDASIITVSKWCKALGLELSPMRRGKNKG